MTNLPRLQIHLSEELLAEIARIGALRLPAEACGVLLPTPRMRDTRSQVIEIPNRSMTPHNSYHMLPSDIRLELEGWASKASPEERNSIAVWHTHPEGGVGPSRQDMQARAPGVSYLVVALTDTGPIPSWF